MKMCLRLPSVTDPFPCPPRIDRPPPAPPAGWPERHHHRPPRPGRCPCRRLPGRRPALAWWPRPRPPPLSRREGSPPPWSSHPDRTSDEPYRTANGLFPPPRTDAPSPSDAVWPRPPPRAPSLLCKPWPPRRSAWETDERRCEPLRSRLALPTPPVPKPKCLGSGTPAKKREQER